MLPKAAQWLASLDLDVIDGIADKVGMGSLITAGVATLTDVLPQEPATYAIIVSIIAGICVIIEKSLLIYIRYHDIKEHHKKDCEKD